MSLAKITLLSAVCAFSLVGFGPAPSSGNLSLTTAYAGPPSVGSNKPKPKKKTTRKAKRKKASAAKKSQSAAKKTTRRAEGKTAKTGPTKVASTSATKSPSKKSRTKTGRRMAHNVSGLAAVAVTAAALELPDSAANPAPSAREADASTQTRKVRKRKKRKASAAKTAQANAARAKRANAGATSKTAANAAGPSAPLPQSGSVGRASDASSVITRQVAGDGATAQVAKKEKAGKKSRFYFTGFFGFFKKKKGDSS
ncbi:hypothetical protein BPTFM16_00112 [Altererythrobacter insulae]|nr:hypothetical protein BPTFM16_00112 [Altererythrobacter insulae]